MLNSIIVGARQNFQCFREIAWFLGNNRALSEFRYHYIISITNNKKINP